ncbi:MAG: hypothetical protein PUF72_02390, partial [Clostridiales bacterium]|nr:hypothetical protein [Clostridiales bacterium]
KNSGTAAAPIEISSYGNANKPIINGDGANAAVYLYNQQYVKVSNLESTNRGTEAWRYGLYVSGYNGGALYGIELRNLTVHDVNGMYTAATDKLDSHWNGGIIVSARGDTATRFVKLVISGCEVYNVSRTGIATFSNMYTSFDKQISGMTQQMKITGNNVHDIKGDGIIVCGDYKGEVSGNTVCNTNLMSYTGESPNVNVGIFVLHSKGTVISGNESYLCRTTYDGFGYDIDGDNDGVIVEYNYSHDNEGGFLLFVNHLNYNATARYNVSKNDSLRCFEIAAFPNTEALQTLKAKIYNNTIYTTSPAAERIILLNTNCSPEVEVNNNIFYLKHDKIMTNHPSGWSASHNLYYGSASPQTVGKYDSAPIYEDPKFENIDGVGNGYDTTDGFMLAGDSPCIGAGIPIQDNGGYDFWGNPVSDTEAPNIGAYNGR